MYVGGAVVVAVKSRGTSGDMCAKNLNAAFLGKDCVCDLEHSPFYLLNEDYVRVGRQQCRA